MAKQAPIPLTKNSAVKLWKIFDLYNFIYIMVASTIITFLLRVIDSPIVAILSSTLLFIFMVGFSFLKVPKNIDEDLPVGQRADAFIFNMIIKRIRHRGVIYVKAIAFEEGYTKRTGKKRLVKKERY